MHNFFPLLQWLPNYKKKDLPGDLLAGFTVAIVLIPQGMAYAMIVGVPPVYGLYASLIPILLYALLGTSRQLAVGPVAMDSLLVAAGLSVVSISGVQNYMAMVILLAFLVGVIQLLLGLLRMGFLVNFLSKPVISGFTSAAALIIIFSQLKHLLGFDIEGNNKFHVLIYNAFQQLPETNPFDFGMGVLGIALILGLKKLNKKIPAILIVVVLGIITAYFFQLDARGLNLVGSIPEGLPSLQVPRIGLEEIEALWPMALTLSLIGYMEAISIARGIEEKNNEDNIDANQELVALGTSNIAGSFFQSFPISASFSRSAINNEMGARTNLSGLFTAILVLLTLLFLTPLFYYLPNTILASIIMVSVLGLIDWEYARSLLHYRKDEFVVLLLTFLITLFIGITTGILIGVLISLLLLVYRTSKPHFAVLGNIRDTDYYKNVDRFQGEVVIRDDLLVVRFDAQLYFGNANYFKNTLFRLIDEKGDALRGVILNAEAINYIDSSAAQMLTQVIKNIHDRNLKFYIAGAIGPTRDIIFSSGIIWELDREFLSVKIGEAVRYFDDPGVISIMGSKVAYQNRGKPT